MKTMKKSRLLSMLLCIAMCLTLLPAAVFADNQAQTIPVDAAHFPDANFRACLRELPGVRMAS